jgi:transposase
MKEVSIIGVDLAKQVFQLHGATAEGEVVFRKKVSRKQFLAFMQAHPRCRVAMEACATAHHWARTLMSLGHEVRLIAPKFVKPYVKNQKNDMADAEAIAEAASRPAMRFVEVKTPEQQGLGMIFRLRDLLVGQRTQTVNALRGHLAEFGVITAKGRENIDKLRSALERDEETADIPASVRHMAQLCFDQIDDLSRRITDLDAQIAAASRCSRFSARLQRMPGIGPITSMALAALRTGACPGLPGARSSRAPPSLTGVVECKDRGGGEVRPRGALARHGLTAGRGGDPAGWSGSNRACAHRVTTRAQATP